VGLLIAFWELARLLWRFRSFQKIYENGETTMVTLEDVSTHGDEINMNGQYSYKRIVYPFSTTIQKNRRTKHLTEGDQFNLVVDRDNPQNAYVQDLYTPDSPEEIRQTVREPSRPKLFWEPKSGYTGIEDPSEAEIIKVIRDVYDGKAGFCILEIDKKNNLFMQIGKDGDPLEYCVGPDGPIHGASGVSVDTAIECFISYSKGDELWKTMLPWKVHVESFTVLESID
jgi:hypothetical protein